MAAIILFRYGLQTIILLNVPGISPHESNDQDQIQKQFARSNVRYHAADRSFHVLMRTETGDRQSRARATPQSGFARSMSARCPNLDSTRQPVTHQLRARTSFEAPLVHDFALRALPHRCEHVAAGGLGDRQNPTVDGGLVKPW